MLVLVVGGAVLHLAGVAHGDCSRLQDSVVILARLEVRDKGCTQLLGRDTHPGVPLEARLDDLCPPGRTDRLRWIRAGVEDVRSFGSTYPQKGTRPPLQNTRAEVFGNLLFNVNRETVGHGAINSYERQSYINDRGMLRDKSSNPMPSVLDLDGGATPGYRLASTSTATVIARYRRVTRNFVVANYRTIGPHYTDDGTSRVLGYLNFNVFGQQTMSPHYNSEWVYNVASINAYAR